MPKSKRTANEINELKQNILNTAIKYVDLYGFENLSMRKLANELNITATTLYNYYSSKDELYLVLLTWGFEQLVFSMTESYNKKDTPLNKLKGVLKSFIKFGITKPNFYNIMFNENVPKYLDYVNTPLEDVAKVELITAMPVWYIINKAASESGICKTISKDTLNIFMAQFLCMIHGITSFINSKITDYIFDKPIKFNDEFIDKFINTFLSNFLPPK